MSVYRICSTGYHKSLLSVNVYQSRQTRLLKITLIVLENCLILKNRNVRHKRDLCFDVKYRRSVNKHSFMTITQINNSKKVTQKRYCTKDILSVSYLKKCLITKL